MRLRAGNKSACPHFIILTGVEFHPLSSTLDFENPQIFSNGLKSGRLLISMRLRAGKKVSIALFYYFDGG